MQLSVENISKQYASVLAVNELSFSVHTGEIFAILGPNGAGKSSTIRMLIGLTQADSGTIEFTSRNGQKHKRLISEDFGYLPEERGLFQESSLINTLVYIGQLKGMSKQEAITASEDWLDRFDLSSRKNDALKTLSKGNQQKVQLISAIIHKPSIAFLDEPFSGLDPINQEKVIEFLIALKAQGTTIILSAHQMSLVEKLADRFLLMDKGGASLYGDLKSIRTQSNLGASLQLQFDTPVDCAEFEALDGVIDVSKVDDANIHISLTPSASIPDLLKHILQHHQVQSLQSAQPSLHDIYLNSLQGGAHE
ncbi:ATP-binding cassette domain-containing protein [Glaciecola sp. XM2]|jgi:ABC-2 type transport system ATP-binding protein|uniref:ABC transporter ATP-binding protein n=1 Tax=Glaciecola sp. XM2 TaxID=1914931 RepID=UPI001BDDD3B6|nr:ATP-binding cassette domain-containing protein [Glaciecola sp. XM2]MBT1451247.1 ATP-binding cassette domain-containing protein [Glaciecola sp. XM2]